MEKKHIIKNIHQDLEYLKELSSSEEDLRKMTPNRLFLVASMARHMAENMESLAQFLPMQTKASQLLEEVPPIDPLTVPVSPPPEDSSTSSKTSNISSLSDLLENEQIASPKNAPLPPPPSLLPKLSASIGLNERIGFVRHLFNGNTEKYKEAIAAIEQLSDTEQVAAYLETLDLPDNDVKDYFVNLALGRIN